MSQKSSQDIEIALCIRSSIGKHGSPNVVDSKFNHAFCGYSGFQTQRIERRNPFVFLQDSHGLVLSSPDASSLFPEVLLKPLFPARGGTDVVFSVFAFQDVDCVTFRNAPKEPAQMIQRLMDEFLTKLAPIFSEAPHQGIRIPCDLVIILFR